MKIETKYQNQLNTMRIFSLLLVLVFYVLTLSQALPLADPNLKCVMNCDIQEFKPICATDDAGETKSFNNVCIMKTENCLRSSSFQKTADGVCP